MSDLTRVAALEASSRAALPALHEERVGGWLLRVSGGDTKRVNSANPMIAGARPEAVIAAAAERYAEHGLPCRFRLTPVAHPNADAVLAGAGFDVMDASITMAAPLAARRANPGLMLCPRFDVAWFGRGEVLSGRSQAAAAVQAGLLAAIAGPIALARIEEEGMTVAAGYASVDAAGARAQLSDIVVAPDARGRGLGRRLVAGLLGWAHAQGCAEAMLQVLAANAVARALYRSLGFVDVYPYHYRVRR